MAAADARRGAGRPFQGKSVDWFASGIPSSHVPRMHDYDHLLPLARTMPTRGTCPSSRNSSRVSRRSTENDFPPRSAWTRASSGTRCGSGFSSPRRFAPGSPCAWLVERGNALSPVHAVLRPVFPRRLESIIGPSRGLAAFLEETKSRIRPPIKIWSEIALESAQRLRVSSK